VLLGQIDQLLAIDRFLSNDQVQGFGGDVEHFFIGKFFSVCLEGDYSLICFLFESSATIHSPFSAAGGFQKNTHITEIMKNSFQRFYTE
jgi:hypothetical protein